MIDSIVSASNHFFKDKNTLAGLFSLFDPDSTENTENDYTYPIVRYLLGDAIGALNYIERQVTAFPKEFSEVSHFANYVNFEQPFRALLLDNCAAVRN